MNGILVIDKEKNMTSRDVVNQVCDKLGTKHVGHTGTLDPIATGVLVLGINNGCKIIDLLTSNIKTYEAEVIIGLQTETLDVTGDILEQVDNVNIDLDKIKEVINNFPKEYLQIVPIYSALHVNGKRLYEYARSGEEVDLPKRNVQILSLELISDLEKDEYYSFKIRTTVSKGTYIRSLIRDIGERLGYPCCMKELRRIRQGIFDINEAYKLDEVDKNIKLISIKDALSDYEKITVDDEIAFKVSNGQKMKFDTNSDVVIVVDNNDKLLAIYKRYDKDPSLMKPFKVFKEDL